MLELSYRNKDKITAKCLKRSHFKNFETKTTKFLRKTLLRNYFLYRCTQTAVSQESLALNFNEMPLLLKFRDSTCILNWLASFNIFHSCTILLQSICHTGFLLNLGCFQ